jgi:ubiquinone/menaquinone biosynthesis C-methylase UbiE
VSDEDVVGEVLRQDDPDAVRREYADEAGLSARIALWARAPGPQPQEVAFDEVIAAAPHRVIEVGCGRGEFAEALVKAGIEVVAVDQSPRMVELTAARGVDALVGDIQELGFPTQSFDAAVANFMLYHVPDLDRGLSELARVLRPGGVLVAATNSVHQLAEMWELVGRDLSDRADLFSRETGEPILRRHFRAVRRTDLDSTIALTASEMRHYIAHSVRHRHLADRVPEFAGTLTVTTGSCVFVATT